MNAADRPIWYDTPPPGYWQLERNSRAFMVWLEKKLDFKTPEDWYQITKKDFQRYGGLGAVSAAGSIFRLIEDYIPWYDWKPWLFNVVPRGYWDDHGHRRRFLEWLGEQLGYTSYEDWYKVTQREIRANRGGTVLVRFGSCTSRLVMEHFPEHDWKPWRFNKTPKTFWADAKNRRRYLEWLGEQLGYESYEDWYQVRYSDFLGNHGCTPVWSQGTNPYRLVMSVFHEHEWQEWRFGKLAKGFFDDRNNARRYLSWLRDSLGFEGYEGFYNIKTEHLDKNHGSTLLHRYRGSIFNMISDTFPEYEFLEWLFGHVSKRFWRDPANCRRYLNWLGSRLGYESFEDWYQVTCEDFVYGKTLLAHYKASYSAVLKRYFPEYEWCEWLFGTIPRDFWKIRGNRRRYLKWLENEWEIETPDVWYLVSAADIAGLHGATLLRYHYGGSHIALLQEVLPEYGLKEELFMLPRKYV